MKIEILTTKELIPYVNNARTHSEKQVSQIAASIQEFGFNNPVLIDGTKGIIAGHGRVMAAKKLGIDEVPCVRLEHLSEAQKKAYILADNKLALNAGWDDELLKIELGRLQDEYDFDLGLIGFSDEELDAYLADANASGNTDENEVPDIPENPVSLLGDVWLLGKHRVICGDSTDPETVAKVLNGVEPNLMVTDPPYGVNYDPTWREGHDSGVGKRAQGKVLNDDKADWREAWALFPGNIAYVWHGGLHSHTVAESLVACDFKVRAQIIWAKQHFVLSRGDYHWQHEPCWYAVRKSGTGNWKGDRKQTTIWNIANNSPFGNPNHEETVGHGTQKPIECMRRPIENNSSPGQAVYEPFSGSGSTIIACEQSGRVCHALELSPAYVDVAVKRWQDFTGKKAVHEASGKTFEEVQDGR